MRQETRTLYFIDELSPEARERAVRGMRCSVGVAADYTSQMYDIQALLLAFGIEPGKAAPFLSFYWDEYAAAVEGAWYAGAFDPRQAADWVELAGAAKTMAEAVAILPAATVASLDSIGPNCEQRINFEYEGEPTEELDDAVLAAEAALLEVIGYAHRILLSEQEYMQSDEFLIELAAANGWEYTRDGERA
jgi:hypothetical protein